MAKRFFGPTALGIDIHDDHIKLALLSQGLTKRVTLFGLLNQPLDHGMIEKGSILQPSAFKQIIVNGLRRFKLELHDVVASISIPQEKIYLTTLPSSEPEQLSVPDMVEDVFPIHSEDAEIRSLNLGNTEKRRVFLAATDKSTVANLVSVCDEIHLQVGALEFESLALARLMRFDNHKPSFLLILDIGAWHTTCVAFHIESGIFTEYRLKTFSGIKLTEVIAQALHVSLDQAESIKRMYGIHFPPSQKPQAMSAIQTLSVLLMNELNGVFSFLGTHHGSPIPMNTPLILVGGGSQMIGLEDVLSHVLNRPVFTWKPSHQFRLIPKMPITAYASFATSVGSALRILQYE